jgi:hypothetical protein
MSLEKIVLLYSRKVGRYALGLLIAFHPRIDSIGLSVAVRIPKEVHVVVEGHLRCHSLYWEGIDWIWKVVHIGA